VGRPVNHPAPGPQNNVQAHVITGARVVSENCQHTRQVTETNIHASCMHQNEKQHPMHHVCIRSMPSLHGWHGQLRQTHASCSAMCDLRSYANAPLHKLTNMYGTHRSTTTAGLYGSLCIQNICHTASLRTVIPRCRNPLRNCKGIQAKFTAAWHMIILANAYYHFIGHRTFVFLRRHIVKRKGQKLVWSPFNAHPHSLVHQVMQTSIHCMPCRSYYESSLSSRGR